MRRRRDEEREERMYVSADDRHYRRHVELAARYALRFNYDLRHQARWWAVNIEDIEAEIRRMQEPEEATEEEPERSAQPALFDLDNGR